jgi:2-haloacid dehalogenase
MYLEEKYKIYGLTNWSGETISVAYKRYPFFKEFDGIVVSGVEKLIKPDKKIFYVLLDRYHLKAEYSVYIDDNIANVQSAKEIGMNAIHFQNAGKLEEELLSIKAI